MNTRFFLLTTLLSLFSESAVFSQNFTLSGYVKDERSGETLIGVNVFNKDNRQQGAATNTYGFYSLTLPQGVYAIKFSYVGFQDKEVKVDLGSNQTLNVGITEGVELQEVVVTAQEKDKNVTRTEMGTVTLAIDKIKKTTVLFGEADVLKEIGRAHV